MIQLIFFTLLYFLPTNHEWDCIHMMGSLKCFPFSILSLSMASGWRWTAKKMKFVFLSKSRISFFFLSFQILTMFIEEKEKEREEYSFVSKQPEKMISLLRFLLIIHSVCVCVFISERKKNWKIRKLEEKKVKNEFNFILVQRNNQMNIWK